MGRWPRGDGEFAARAGHRSPGAGLASLAHAPDGLVEAFGGAGRSTFAYAVQFHPEWRCWETPFYAAIFEAFGRPVGSAADAQIGARDRMSCCRQQRSKP